MEPRNASPNSNTNRDGTKGEKITIYLLRYCESDSPSWADASIFEKPKSEPIPVEDDVDWLRRSQMWQKLAPALAHRAKRERPRTPLILSGRGAYIRRGR